MATQTERVGTLIELLEKTSKLYAIQYELVKRILDDKNATKVDHDRAIEILDFLMPVSVVVVQLWQNQW